MEIYDDESGMMYLRPLRTVKVDLVNVFKRIFEIELNQDIKPYLQTIQLLNDLRNELFIDMNDIWTINLSIIIKLKKYISLLNSLNNDKLPIDVINFQWDDKIDNSLQFEINSSIYQLGSYYSILAIIELRNEDYKKSGIYSQYCIGCLSILNDKFTCLMKLMLAQSQEIYLLQAQFDNFKNSILIKISMQISDYYNDCIDNDYNYLKFTYFKLFSYILFANINFNKNNKSIGQMYILESRDIINQCNYENYSKFTKIIQDFESLKLKLNVEMEMDSNALVKPFNTLPELPRVILVKSLIPNHLNDETIFDSLIPYTIVTQLIDCSKQFENFINEQLISPLEEISIEIDKLLKKEKIIQDSINNDQIPPIIVEQKSHILQNGGIEIINELYQNLTNLKSKCRLSLDNTWTKINEHDMKKIEKDPVGSMLINSFKIYENYIKQSEDGDELINTQVNELKPFLEIYNSEDSLKEYLPSSNVLEINPKFKEKYEHLINIIESLKQFKKNVDNTIIKVNDKAKKCDIFENYRNNRDIDLDELLKNLIFKFTKDVDTVTQFNEDKIEKYQQFENVFKDFNRCKENVKISNKRLESIKVLKSTFEGFNECLNNLNNGMEFYQNLIDNITVKNDQLDNFLSKI